jgi:hypothetical protein
MQKGFPHSEQLRVEIELKHGYRRISHLAFSLKFIGYALTCQGCFAALSLTIQGFANGAPLERQGMILACSSGDLWRREQVALGTPQ